MTSKRYARHADERKHLKDMTPPQRTDTSEPLNGTGTFLVLDTTGA